MLLQVTVRDCSRNHRAATRSEATPALGYTSPQLPDCRPTVSIESLNQDLARLEADVRKLAGDSQRLTQDLGDQAKTVREEIVAAEFIATEEAIENAGSVLEALAQIGDIQREQLRVLFEDHKESWAALRNVRSPLGLAEIGFDHWKRRATHVAGGLNQVVDVFVGEGRHMTSAMFQMWKPFLKLVQRDWGAGKS